LKLTVGVSDMKVSSNPGDVIVTHALGSCLGIVMYDPVSTTGGMFHALLPQSSVSPDKAEKNPYMFIDTGTPRFVDEIKRAGGDPKRLVIKVAGGAQIREGADVFAIGKRNFVALRKVFWNLGLVIRAHDTGGDIARTMTLDLKTGHTTLMSKGTTWDL